MTRGRAAGQFYSVAAERPAVKRAYAIANAIDTQPSISDDEARRVLYAQNKDTVR